MTTVVKKQNETTEECYMCGGVAYEIACKRDLSYGRVTATVDGTCMQCSSCGEKYFTPGQLEVADRQAARIKKMDGKIWPSDIRRLRLQLGLTQESIEKAFGLAAKAVNHWEHGKSSPEGPTVALLRGLEAGALTLDQITAWRTGRTSTNSFAYSGHLRPNVSSL